MLNFFFHQIFISHNDQDTYHSESSSSGEFAPTGEALPRNHLRLRADAVITPLRVQETAGGGGTLCTLQIQQPHLSHYDRDEDDYITGYKDSTLQARLSSPFYFTQLPNGQIAEIYHSDGESAWGINIKRGILSTLQVTHDIASSEDLEYQAEETDVTGTCYVNYKAAHVLAQDASSEGPTKKLLTLDRRKHHRDCDRHARGGSEHSTQDISAFHTAVHHLHPEHHVLVRAITCPFFFTFFFDDLILAVAPGT
jgi:hypothetical protein